MSITLIIIIVTVIISWQAFNRPEIIQNYRHFPFMEKRSNQLYRWLTAGFLHANFMHLGINMFVLYSFGTYVETVYGMVFGDVLGKIYYVLVYILMIVFANIPTYLKHQDNGRFSSIGASGAVSGIVFIFVLFEPWELIYLFAIIPIPAIVAAVLFLLYSSWAGKQGKDMIDHEGHFYGALSGFLLTILLKTELLQIFLMKLSNVPSISEIFG